MRSEHGFTLIELLVVIAIIGILAAIAIPSLLNALERSKQAMTVDRIQKIGTFVEQYIMDFNEVGCPKVGSDPNALIPIFKSTEINFNDFLVKDAWGSTLVIDMNATIGSRAYTIQSYGSDSLPGPQPATAGIVKLFKEDIIWSQGLFQQRPEGSQKSE